jgi:hypothetical protein
MVEWWWRAVLVTGGDQLRRRRRRRRRRGTEWYCRGLLWNFIGAVGKA